MVNGATDKWRERYPDMIADYPDGAFVVKSAGLPFSVLVFSSVAAVGTVLLRLRRRFCDGELGGATHTKVACGGGMVGLWACYIVASIWGASADDDAKSTVSALF